jgi:tRNA (cytidine/uridine-2'-O-)-methyltransferase
VHRDGPTSAPLSRRIARKTATERPIEVRMRIALYQPDIPQNTGTILRLCACFGIAADIIEPAGFPVSDRAFRRAGMDYLDAVTITRHPSWREFETWRRGAGHRLVLLTTAASVPYLDHRYRADDILLLGRESAGVPEDVHASADARVVIPMRPGLRSLNVAVAAAMVVGEALRQTGEMPTVQRRSLG